MSTRFIITVMSTHAHAMMSRYLPNCKRIVPIFVEEGVPMTGSDVKATAHFSVAPSLNILTIAHSTIFATNRTTTIPRIQNTAVLSHPEIVDASIAFTETPTPDSPELDAMSFGVQSAKAIPAVAPAALKRASSGAQIAAMDFSDVFILLSYLPPRRLNVCSEPEIRVTRLLNLLP